MAEAKDCTDRFLSHQTLGAANLVLLVVIKVILAEAANTAID